MHLGQLFATSVLALSIALTGYSADAEAGSKNRSKNRVKVVYNKAKHHTAKSDPSRYIVTKNGELRLASSAALVIDQEGGNALYAKRPDAVSPIASITKLMTAMVVLDAQAANG